MPILIITLYLGHGSKTYDSCDSSTLLHQKLACRSWICLQILFSSLTFDSLVPPNAYLQQKQLSKKNNKTKRIHMKAAPNLAWLINSICLWYQGNISSQNAFAFLLHLLLLPVEIHDRGENDPPIKETFHVCPALRETSWDRVIV